MKRERAYIAWLAGSAVGAVAIVGAAGIVGVSQAVPLASATGPTAVVATAPGASCPSGTLFTTPRGTRLCLTAPPFGYGGARGERRIVIPWGLLDGRRGRGPSPLGDLLPEGGGMQRDDMQRGGMQRGGMQRGGVIVQGGAVVAAPLGIRLLQVQGQAPCQSPETFSA